MGTDAQRERALKLAERLLEIAPGNLDEGMLMRVQQIRDRLKTPMAQILEKVPGDSLSDRARRIGITRQCYYAWLRGEYRPNLRQSKRLANLTGLRVEEIFWKANA
jgi:DNA-binding XRE family transcriptional regulator